MKSLDLDWFLLQYNRRRYIKLFCPQSDLYPLLSGYREISCRNTFLFYGAITLSNFFAQEKLDANFHEMSDRFFHLIKSNFDESDYSFEEVLLL